MPVSSLPEGLALRLADLPAFSPPDSLRERIVALHALRTRRRWLLPAALAAGLVLAFVAVTPRVGAPSVARAPRPLAPVDAVTDTQARSRALEADLAAAPRGDNASAAILAAESELARVDLALQSAYDRRATAVELERLWLARTELLSTLVAAYRHPDAVVRI